MHLNSSNSLGASLKVYITEAVRAAADKQDNLWVANEAGKAAAWAAWALAKHHRRVDEQKKAELDSSRSIIHDRVNGAAAAVKAVFVSSIATGTTSLAGGFAMVGGALLTLAAPPIGGAVMVGGALTSAAGGIATVVDEPIKKAAVDSAFKTIGADDSSNMLVKGLHYIFKAKEAIGENVVKETKCFEWVDMMLAYFLDYDGDIDTLDPVAELQSTINASVQVVRAGYAMDIAEAANLASLHRDFDRHRVDLLLNHIATISASALAGVISLSCVWASQSGAEMAAGMTKVFEKSGVALAPRFLAKHANTFKFVGGIAAVVGGLVTIVLAIVQIVAAVKAKDAMMQKLEEQRQSLLRTVESLSKPPFQL